MNTKELFQNEILEEIKALAGEISRVKNFSGLLMHQQKIQALYEKFNFLKQFHSSKYQQFINEELEDKNNSQVIIKEEVLQRDFYESEKSIDEKVKDHKDINEVLKNEEKQNEEIENSSEEVFIPGWLKSVVFAEQLFDGNRVLMVKEMGKLNNAGNLLEAKNWVESMFIKYNWKDKQEYVEHLSKIIIERFSENEKVEKVEEETVITLEEPKLKEEVLELKKADSPKIFKEWEKRVEEISSGAINEKPESLEIDLSESIDYISHLFNGSKADMDKEVKDLNSTVSVEDSLNWIKKMYLKYNWEGREESFNIFVKSIFDRFVIKVEKKERLTPLSVEIAEIKIKNTKTVESSFNPIKLDLNDSIAFISQLFGGSKSEMDKEFGKLNTLPTPEDSKEWMEKMSEKYDWSEKKEYTDRLDELINQRFNS